VSAVATDELQARSRECDLEHARIRRVGEVEADDLPQLGLQREVGFPVDEQHVSEAAHRRMSRHGAAEGGDLAVLKQDVVEG
jgi:hypothetical protein